MPTHKDLLQAHRLMTQRSALALITGEPDSPHQPLRRLNTGLVSSLLVAAIAAAVFAVLGLIAPASASNLTKAGTLVIDSGTATAYVPCDHGKLCPALNYPSALLALDSDQVRRVEASPAALGRYPGGPTIGVPGLPQDLPAPADLVTGPWAVCAASGATTLVGGRAVGGTVLGPASAALVTTGQGDVWVLWNGQRLAIEPRIAQTLFPAMRVQTVPLAWLNTLPQGPGFAAPPIAGQGQTVTGPDGAPATVGQIFAQAGAGGAVAQYFVLLADGHLAQIDGTQAQLLEREPGAPAEHPVSPSAATADLSGTAIPRHGLPATVPALSPVTSAVCVSYPPDLRPRIVTGATVPSGATPTGVSSPAALTQVWLPPAHGALIGAAPAAGRTGVTSYFLLTGSARYALPAQRVAAVLGYTLKTQSAALPAGILDLLPSGPALNPSAATKPAANPATSG